MEAVIGLACHYLEKATIPAILEESSQSKFLVQVAATYLVNSIGGIAFYLATAGASFLYFYIIRKGAYYPSTLPKDNEALNKQIYNEITYAIWSIPIMAVLMTPFQLAILNGYGKVYENVEDYGWAYFFFSIFWFLLFTDCCIYFIHRALHWPILYKYVHKPHHTYQHTTPFSSHSFHPLDGWAQGVPYYIFALLFPIHNKLFMSMFIFVNFWTVSIHDQVDFLGEGVVNSTSHHTIHHELFKYNYGQYFTLWDRVCGTYKAAQQTNSIITGERLQVPEKKTVKAKTAKKVD